MPETGPKEARIDIPYIDGVNSLVGYNIGKKTELFHAENARSKVIGTIEKREGQTVVGTNSSAQPFITTDNYALFPFQNRISGIYRISADQDSTLDINVHEQVVMSDSREIDHPSGDFPIVDHNTDSVLIMEHVSVVVTPTATIYYLDKTGRQWIALTGEGTGIAGGDFSHAYAEGNVFLVNQADENRYIASNGTTVTSASTATGHLYNSPAASLVNFYKNRLYLGDFIQSSVRYKTSIARSSYPLGIVALVNGDQASHASGSNLNVTDTKYFYVSPGPDAYDVYRGDTKIADITVTVLNETSITVTHTGTPSFLSSDEIWVDGTFTAAKVFRWANNLSVSGRDVKQYDTFKMAGGEDDALTMMTNIGNVMLISNKNSMATWNDYTLENFDLDIGCVSKRGYVKYLGTLYFMHYTGVYATTGGIPNRISSKVSRYITGATKAGMESCAAGKKGDSIFFAIGDVNLYREDGSLEKTMPDVGLEYNIIQQNWYVHTNVKANQFATYVDAANTDRCFFTDTEGIRSVKEFLSGVTDDGKEIAFRIDTQKLTLQSAYERISNPIDAILEIDRGAGMQAYVRVNHEETYYPVEGEAIKGLSILKITSRDIDRGMPTPARLLSISIRDSSKQICRISRMSIIHQPTLTEGDDNDIAYGE